MKSRHMRTNEREFSAAVMARQSQAANQLATLLRLKGVLSQEEERLVAALEQWKYQGANENKPGYSVARELLNLVRRAALPPKTSRPVKN